MYSEGYIVLGLCKGWSLLCLLYWHPWLVVLIPSLSVYYKRWAVTSVHYISVKRSVVKINSQVIVMRLSMVCPTWGMVVQGGDLTSQLIKYPTHRTGYVIKFSLIPTIELRGFDPPVWHCNSSRTLLYMYSCELSRVGVSVAYHIYVHEWSRLNMNNKSD